jgi:tRNA (mo5U34)-methyltransferase
VWHQRFELVPGIYSPGTNDVNALLDIGRIPREIHGASVIDVGTSNGAACFELERRGATRVVAVDIYPPEWFGFDVLSEFFGSRAAFLQSSVYELPARLKGETFDFVLFLGVLYHLRHPLIALDALREISAGQVLIETAVADASVPPEVALVRFYRGDELNRDPSNWFVPTTRALIDWCASSGFSVELLSAWRSGEASRAMVSATPTRGVPEFAAISYERPLRVSRTDVDA